jgi:hypothetical protein
VEASLTIKTVDPPHSRWCQGVGHVVPADAKFQGKDTRFFHVSGDGIDKVVCEPCLTVANAMARRKKDERRNGYSP